MPAKRFIVILATCAGLIGLAQAAELESVLLKKLRENDARYNNVSLNYLEIEDTRIEPDSFHDLKFGMEEEARARPKDYWEPRTVRVVRKCSLVVQGDNIVLSSEPDVARSEKDKYVSFGTSYLGGLIDGIQKEVIDLSLPVGDSHNDKPGIDRILNIGPWKQEHEHWLHQKRLEVELAFGIGLGRRITAITSERLIPEGYEIAGTIKVSSKDVSTFKATLDVAGVLRRAEIDSTYPPGSFNTRMKYETEGTVEIDGVRLAKAGSFKVTGNWPGRITPKAYKVEFTGVKFDLTQKRFATLADFSVQPLTQVQDRVNGIEGMGEIGPDGRVRVRTAKVKWDDRHAGRPAPDIETTQADGEPWKLADQRGKVVLLHFWKASSDSCLAALPELEKVYQTFAQREDFVMAGVSLDGAADRPLAVCKRRNIAWPQLIEPGQGWNNSAARALEIQSLPTVVLIGHDGEIAPIDFPITELENRIQELLEKK